MLQVDGNFDFETELMEMVDQFLADYQAARGPLRNDLERALVISYVLGMIRCDLECIWDCLGKAPIFGPLHPRVVFETCVQEPNDPDMATRKRQVTENIYRRGWLGAPKDET